MNEWGRVCFFGQNDLFTWSMTSQMTAAAALPVVKSPKFGPAWPIEKAPNSTARNVWMVKTERNQISLFSFYWQFSLPFIAKRSFWIRVRLNKSKRNHKHGHTMAKSCRETDPYYAEKACGEALPLISAVLKKVRPVLQIEPRNVYFHSVSTFQSYVLIICYLWRQVESMWNITH